jgi:hypothetical protein
MKKLWAQTLLFITFNPSQKAASTRAETLLQILEAGLVSTLQLVLTKSAGAGYACLGFFVGSCKSLFVEKT